MTEDPTTVPFQVAQHLRSKIIRTGPTANEVLRLWRAGNDTYDIAKALHLPECEIANMLLHIRDVRHRETERA